MAQLGFNHGKLRLSPSTIAVYHVCRNKKGDMIQIDIYGHGGSPINKAGFSPPNIVDSMDSSAFCKHRWTGEAPGIEFSKPGMKTNYWGDPTCRLRTRIWPVQWGESHFWTCLMMARDCCKMSEVPQPNSKLFVGNMRLQAAGFLV